jgi:hypothetical protein
MIMIRSPLSLIFFGVVVAFNDIWGMRKYYSTVVSSFVVVQQQQQQKQQRQIHFRTRPQHLGNVTIAAISAIQQQHDQEEVNSLSVEVVITVPALERPPLFTVNQWIPRRTARRMNHRFKYQELS